MPESISRRAWLERTLAAVPLAFGASRLLAAQAVPIEVHKDPSCGCCEQWVAHMKANGFAPTVHNTPDVQAIKARYKVPGSLASCHTAIVGGYVVEGHVPASDVKTLLSRKPAGVIGLTIPGMPASAPGMDLEPFQPYTVLAFDAAGKTTTFAQHRS